MRYTQTKTARWTLLIAVALATPLTGRANAEDRQTTCLAERFGDPVSERMDAPATPAQKVRLHGFLWSG